VFEQIIQIAEEAGRAILEVYEGSKIDVETKSDSSPLTQADLAAHRIIVNRLAELYPEIPVLSEESDSISLEQRRAWSRYFLVDPLDGTKEFIQRNGEFTVNIALIDQGKAVVGVVHVPVQDTSYFGTQLGDAEAWFIENGHRKEIHSRSMQARQAADPLVVVASRRHGADALERLLDGLRRQFKQVELTNMGSSLKLCLVAAGQADLYPRLAPTSEWDTAAAQAIVEAAGGRVLDLNFQPLRYNQKDSLLNPEFLVVADKEYDWHKHLLF
jgi:3'(2'), 5'-bisphosphate nucleotidase